jgi:hypothetical protein
MRANQAERASFAEDAPASNWLALDDIGRALQDPELSLGVDRIEFNFNVGRFIDVNSVIWESNTYNGVQGSQYSTQLEVGEDWAYVKMIRNQMLGKVFVSVNPSSVRYGKRSGKICPLRDALGVCQAIVNRLGRSVEIPDPLGVARLQRVDVSVDFHNVSDIQGLLSTALMNTYNPQVKAVPYIGVRGIESVACRSKTGGGFLVYNKSQQMRMATSTVRFEAQSRTRHLKVISPTLGDLTEENCRRIFDRYISRLAKALAAHSLTPPEVILADKRYRKTFITAVGLSVLSDRGYPVKMTDYWRLRQYRPFKQRYPHRVIGDLFKNIVGAK